MHHWVSHLLGVNLTSNLLAYMKIPTGFIGLGVDLNLAAGSNNFILHYVNY